MLSFLQKEGVQGLFSLLDNSADIRLCIITEEPVRLEKKKQWFKKSGMQTTRTPKGGKNKTVQVMVRG